MKNSASPISAFSSHYQAQIAAQLHGQRKAVAVPVVTDEAPRLRQNTKGPNKTEAAFVAFGLPEPVKELAFAKPRRWRFDYAWPDQKVALEVEGGVWTGGRHTRGKGFLGDMEKYNAAVVLGWRVVRCTPETLKTFATAEMIKKILRP